MSEEISSKVIFEKYRLIQPISKGSFGLIYLGQNIITKEYVAIKTEDKAKNNNSLQLEYQILLKLQHESIPKVLFYGDDNSHYYLVEELLGNSLEDVFNSSDHKFSLKTVSYLAIEIIKIIRYVHSKNLVHCDIKPANFMFGINGKKDQLYLIDYGLSNQYLNNEDNTHIAFTTDNNLVGTVRYCSINSHLGYQQSRRDDLESIGYMLIYLANGCLPWQGLKLNQSEKWHKTIEKKKIETNEVELCSGLPVQFEEYVKYVRRLDFATEPDYEYLIGLFQTVIRLNGFTPSPSSKMSNEYNANQDSSSVQMQLHGSSKSKSFSIQGESNSGSIDGGSDKLPFGFNESRQSNASGNKVDIVGKGKGKGKGKVKNKTNGGNCKCVIF